MPNLKLALRTLFKTPFVTAVAVLSLALGIGANSAIFSLFDQMLVRALPVAEPGRLVNLKAPGPKPGSQSCNLAGDCDAVFSYPLFRDLEGRQEVFDGLAAHRAFGANLAFEKQTSSGEGILVSGSYFPTLGLHPALGRLLDPGDDGTLGEPQAVVLSYTYWQSRFGASPEVLNQTLVVNGQPLTIVGVAPEGFRGTTLGVEAQVFVPITLRGQMSPGFDGFDDRRNYWAYLFARLDPGVSLEQAKTAVNTVYSGIVNEVEAPLQEGMSEQTMERFRAKQVLLEEGVRGQSSLHELARTPLILLFAVAGVVLLIACANVANLLLARSATRADEMAVRLSVGASRGRLVAQLLAESCLLAVLGGLAGLVVARWTLAAIGRLVPPDAAATLDLSLDPKAVAFAAVLALATGVLFGLFPALHSVRRDLAAMLGGRTGQPSGTRGAAKVRTLLVTGQIALSTALLVAAGLFLKSLVNVSRVDLGLKIDNLVTFSISPQLNGYSPERSQALFEHAEEELAALPGVSGVTASMVPLLAGSNWGNDVSVEGFPAGPDTDTNARFNEVGAGYFRTLGIPLINGREFTPLDIAGTPRVAVVNEAFAKKFNLGREAVGKRMGRGSTDELDIEIVGLVRDAKYSEVKDENPPLFYTPYRQDEEVGILSFYLRTARPPEQVVPEIAGVIARLDPNLPVEELKTMPQQVRENVSVDRMLTTLSAAFAVVATLLAAIGLYGVVAYSVSQRTREIGLRMALGADGGRVRRMVLLQVGRMTLAGGIAGLVMAYGLGSLARSQLFGVGGHDPAVLVGATLLLALVALGSGLLPARHASRIEPMRALRYE